MSQKGPSCYAVIFTSVRTDGDNGYTETASRMLELARTMDGFLGVESAREAGKAGVGITVSYWESLKAIRAWQRHPEHLAAQREGRETWYRSFSTRVCRVLRANVFPES